ncbi:MAG: sigma54 specific transcriptional regulator, Fis family [Myxococcales bacterium]|nr:sigma54 specific transcriptional regulator, Fis family [Myxococcales bacterium]
MLGSVVVMNGIASAPAPGAVQRVLLLAPDDEARRALHLLIDRRGLQVVAATELETARKHLASAECDVVLVSPELAAQVCKEHNVPPVIAVVRTRDHATSLSLLEAGVDDILCDPLDDLALTLALRHVSTVQRRFAVVEAAPSLVGDGALMQKLKATIKVIAATRSTVLILGESGTGKELVARAIHEASPRRHRRFVAINCAAIPAPLLESELFGHVRGAFTDAVRDKPGLFEDADGGTLFLDEVGELPMGLQVKLLRALQESEIRRVGDTASIKVDVRLIAATLRDLDDDVGAGRFREDLYYRLNVLPVQVPALRERAEDIPQLARFFAGRHAARHRRDVALSEPAIEALARQPWPGNVRELENVIERALVLADGPAVDAEFLGTLMKVAPKASAEPDHELSVKKATRSLEADLIRRALGVTAGNRTNAAKLLEISHRALLYKMKEYGIS